MNRAADNPTISPGNRVRPAFIRRMEGELQANHASKGDWTTWRPDADQLLSELDHHVIKLRTALACSDKPGISEYSADIANIAMKASEVLGAD